MKIDKIIIHKILLPFSIEFSHSLRKRTSVKNVVVEVIADQGAIKGYGEGAPRSYVTGETRESAVSDISDFTKKGSFPWTLNNVSQIWNFVDSLPNGKEHNAAICAIETALLDALGKLQGRSIEKYFPQDFYTPTIFYGGTIPIAAKETISAMCKKGKESGITNLRIKMGADFDKNRASIEIARAVLGDDLDIRIDVNGAWNREAASKHTPLLERYNVKVVEQPMRPGDPDIKEFAKQIQKSGIILMADESACDLEDVERITSEGHYKMMNVRLSKCGGFRRSIRIIDFLRKNGLSFQIGCQLGESGILSAAGRALSLLCNDAVYYDGSYDELLLKKNVTTVNVSFGKGGESHSLNGPGLGVEVDSRNLKDFCDKVPSNIILKH
ncbi:MAG: hypothetical protein GY864_09540 [Desulfobacterales bacterium]|nr:hypothetical protein [Desulfobacterales bacterium]